MCQGNKKICKAGTFFTWSMFSNDDLDVMQTFFTLVTCDDGDDQVAKK